MIIPGSASRLKLSDAEYFGNALPGYISNSKLGLINPAQGGSLSRYVSGFEDSKSDFFKLGTAIHALLLEADSNELSTFVAPKGVVRDIIDTTYKLVKNGQSFDMALSIAVKYHNYYNGEPGEKRMQSLVAATSDYYDYLSDVKEGEIILDATMRSTVISCVSSVKANPEAYKAICSPEGDFDFLDNRKYFNEDVMTCEYQTKDGTVLKLKNKVDSWSIDVENKILYLTDLKTTSSSIDTFMGQNGIQVFEYADMRPSFIHGSFHKYHYYRQMYMYYKILETYATQEYGFDPETWKVEVRMVVVETTGSNRSAIFNVSDELMQAGKQEMEFLLEMIAENKQNIPELNVIQGGTILFDI